MQRVPLNIAGALGLDLRTDVGDVNALRAATLRNLDVVAGLDSAAGARVRVRPPCRRWGSSLCNNPTAATIAGAGIGPGWRWHRFVWTRTDGTQQLSEYTGTYFGTGEIAGYRITWPGSVGSGTVALYRTKYGFSSSYTATYYLVAEGIDPTAGTFDDTLADDDLGAAINYVPAMAPLGNENFNQTALFDFLLPWLSSSGTRYIRGVIRTNGPSSSGLRFAALLNDAGDCVSDPTTYASEAYPTTYALLDDHIWTAAAGQTLRRWDEAVTQPSQPTISSVTQPGAGALSAATGHIYAVVRVDDSTGVMSLPSAPVTIAGPYASKTNTITMSAAAGSGLTYKLYRTTDGGAQYRWVKDFTGSSTTDESSDFDLSAELIPRSDEVGALQYYAFIAEHKGHLVAANERGTTKYGSRLRVSSSLYPYNWPTDPEYTFDVAPDDGDEIFGGASWGEVFVVFKRNSVHLLSGGPPTSYRVTRLPGSEGLGCIAPRTIRVTRAGLFYLSSAGVCLMREPGAPPELVSEPIAPVLREAQAAAAFGTAEATPALANIAWAHALDYADRGEYLLWLPYDGGYFGELCFVLDYGGLATNGPVWREMVLPASAACIVPRWALAGQPARNYVLLGSPDGLLYVWPWNFGGGDFDTGVTVASPTATASMVDSGGAHPDVESADEPAWPTDGFGLRGGVVTARQTGRATTYTGLILDNTADTLSVRWLGGRVPPLTVTEGDDYVVTIGGVAWELATAWLEIGGGRAQVVRQLEAHVGHGTGDDPVAAALAVRGARSVDLGVAGGLVERVRERNLSGGDVSRAQVDVRGLLHQCALAGAGRPAALELRKFELAVDDAAGDVR